MKAYPMKKPLKNKIATLVVSTALLTACQTTKEPPKFTGDYQTGVNAYATGDFKTALIHFKPLAENGSAGAQLLYGAMHEAGDGVPKDYKQAANWYRKSAVQGNAGAQFLLGKLYYNGNGVIKDYKIVYMWLNIASSNGNEDAKQILNKIERTLPAADISKAQEMSSRCFESGYAHCGYE